MRRHAGVDAAAAEKLQLLAAVLPSSVDDVHLEDHVVVHEVGQGVLVSDDAADFGCGEEDVFGLFGFEEGLHLVLTRQVEFLVRPCDDVGIALSLQFTDDGRAHHPTVTGDVYFAVYFHFYSISSNTALLDKPKTGDPHGGQGSAISHA